MFCVTIIYNDVTLSNCFLGYYFFDYLESYYIKSGKKDKLQHPVL